jgi:effector-binding domain-containing protein
MKYLKIALFTSIVAIFGYLYLFIPTNIKVSNFIDSKSPELRVVRLIDNHALLTKSVGKYYDSTTKKIIIDNVEFTLNNALSNMIQINVNTSRLQLKSFITANSVTKETSTISWFCDFQTSYNPLQRWLDYNEAVKIKKASATLIQHINEFVEHPINVYGFDIKEITLKDTILISTKFVSKSMPTNEQIYKAAKELTAYLKSYNKTALENPMVTVFENNTNNFTVRVGISIDGEIPANEKFTIKKMPVFGKMFVTDVTGNQSTIRDGYAAVKLFLLDSKRPSPAVPFELLINDRQSILDSSQWKTRIFYPVM